MRRFLLASIFCLVSFGAFAQTNSGPPPATPPMVLGCSPVFASTSLWISPFANCAAVNTPQTIATLAISGADGAASVIDLDSYGAVAALDARRVDGTAASRTGLIANDIILAINSVGWTSAAAYSGTASQIQCSAGETWSGTQTGTFCAVKTTPLTTVTLAEAARFQPSGGLSVGTTTDPGIGSLQLNGQQFMPNVTTSSAAQTGTVCWTTGTGKLTVDTTLGCLASLEELKDKKGPIVNAMDEIAKLEPFWYSWKEGTPERAGDTHVQPGLGAHQVESVDSRLTGYGTDGKLSGVRYAQMVALLVAGMKELKADNDDLRREMVIMRHQTSEKKRAK